MITFRQIFLFLSLIVIVGVSKADELPVSKADLTQIGFDSSQLAMKAAAQELKTISITNEVAGAIYLYNNKYYYTLGVTQSCSDCIDYKIALPHNAKLVALYHSHPGDKGADDFSPDDLNLAKRLNTAMYVVVLKTDNVIGYKLPGFSLDVIPVVYPTVMIDNKVYRLISSNDSQRVLEYNGRKYIQKLSR